MPSSMEPLAVRQGLKEMVEASSIAAVAAATKISAPTIASTARGDGKLRQKTAEAIMTTYDAWKAGTLKLSPGRKKREPAPPKPKTLTLDKKALQAELDQLERKAEAIRSLMKLY